MPDIYPPYIFGVHDRGGEHLMLGKRRYGWVLVTEALGSDPNNLGGNDYTDLTTKGLSVIVRLNNGYGYTGTIPYSARYDSFSRRCGNFVEASDGCHIWIIGNEMNLSAERPGGPNGQTITPELYATCFLKCRAEIRRRPGHEEDQVVVGAVGPWNAETRYPGNEQGNWVQYFRDILDWLGEAVDGISIHTYTHGQNPNLVFSDDRMHAPYQNYHYHFRAYRDFMKAIPALLSDRPVYITETDQYGAWRDDNTGWVQNAYQEINAWNLNPGNQPIQALILYRWIIGNLHDAREVGWAIENKPGVQDDFDDAMENAFRVVLPRVRPDYQVGWLEVGAPGRWDPGTTVSFGVMVRNDGRLTWATSGLQAVRLAYRWLDAEGTIIEGERMELPGPVVAGQTITIPAVSVRAPDEPGYYALELDMVEGESGWFADQGSPTWRAEEVRVGARYRVAWLRVSAPSEGTVGERLTFPVLLRNEGALTWSSADERPVFLTYKWLDADRNVVVGDGLRSPLGRLVPPMDEVETLASVQAPPEAGRYILQLDMVHEFVAWFQWKGSPVYEVQMEVNPLVPDYAAEWSDYVGPDRVVIGQQGSAVVEVKNVGTQPWPRSGDGAIRLGYRWFDAQAEEVPVPDASTWPMPETVEPGDTATFRDLPFDAPAKEGAYRLVWDLKRDDTWLSAEGAAVLERTMQVVAPEYGVQWQVLEPWPAWVPPGKEQHTSLRLCNVGTRAWAAGGTFPVHLAYTWFTKDGLLSEPWDTFRIRLPHDVASGAEVDLFDIGFKAPQVLGEYVLRWDLVEEGRTWFFRQGALPLEVPVEVSDRTLFVPWTAQASHNPEEVVLAFDGNADTFWDSKAAQEPGMWFLVDLGQVLVLDRVRVASPGRGFPVGYKVKLSEEGQDWHLVAESPKNWSSIDAAFAPCKARFLRLEQTGTPGWPASWMIGEISVSATEAWAGVETSHYTADAYKAWDARLRTAWNTRAVKQKPGMWFKLDMGGLRRIERVTLEHPKNQLPRGYVVQVSSDGQEWQEIGRKDDNWGMVDVKFQPVVARYVQVVTTNSSPYHPWGVAELAVWRTSPVWIQGRLK